VRDRRADYGIDAPIVPAVFGAITAVAAVVTVVVLVGGEPWWWILGLICLWFGLQTASFLYTTTRGKFEVWDRLLDDLDLRGDERCVDMGCGRGAVLVALAGRLLDGHVTGVDLWRTADQSGNALDVAQRNVRSAHVADRVTLTTADMTSLPIPTDAVDLVVSALAIHNIKSESGRSSAVREAVRVLRPGGRLLIADIQSAKEYERALRRHGAVDVRRRGLGWRYWYGGPWMATSLVTARKR
jgi:cyclopropane fatty-acyl-phospholipid synthase-like methyltransferase